MDEFYEISIRGRVAYAIRCLEEALIYYKYPLNQWIWVLETFWTYTDIEFLDDWFYEMAEYMPDSILERSKYGCDFEFVTEEQFLMLYSLYQETNEIIKKIMRIIFEMGSGELYGKIEGKSQLTLRLLLELYNLMKNHKIRMPSSKDYLNSSFNENGGYGNDFEGKVLSAILKG